MEGADERGEEVDEVDEIDEVDEVDKDTAKMTAPLLGRGMGAMGGRGEEIGSAAV